MGLLFVDKSADFSANPVGHAGLFTSLTTGLEALHELRKSASKTINNSAPGKPSGAINGAPIYSPTSVQVSNTNKVQFGSRPVSGGLTLAVIVKMKTGGTSSDHVCISDVPGSGINGSCFMTLYNRRVSAVGYTYPAPAASPLSGYEQAFAYLDLTEADDGNYEMFFLTLEDNAAIRLRRAKTEQSYATATPGKNFAFDKSNRFITRQAASNDYSQDLSLFAHWSRVLTVPEMITFYAEMKAQYAVLGLAI